MLQLAELDLLGVVPVASCAQHHEQGVAVALQFRALAGGDGVLHRQLVQPELVSRGRQLSLGRSVQAVQAMLSGCCASCWNVSASVAGHAIGRPARYTTLLILLPASDN
jgi:hypothetical protein